MRNDDLCTHPHSTSRSSLQVTTELRTLYGAAHRNVVKYSAAFFDNGAITIAMEYCDAGSLADLLKVGDADHK